MTATKRISPIQKSINAFLEKHTCPFTGTDKNPYDLNIAEEQKQRPTPNSIVNALPTIYEYLNGKKSPVTLDGCDIVLEAKPTQKEKGDHYVEGFETLNYSLLAINPENGLVWGSENSIPFHSVGYSGASAIKGKSEEDFDTYSYREVEILMINDLSPGGLIVGKTLILNADEDANDNRMIGDELSKNFPAVSFGCIANLFAGEVVTEGAVWNEWIDSILNLSVLDFTAEEKKDVEQKIRDRYRSESKKPNFSFQVWAAGFTPPAKGFSLVVNSRLEWHKSPTVLIKNGNKTYLLGQDEGTYFGCELADNPKTIDAAYTSLMPKTARGVKGVIRQGEWFAIPVANQNSVPTGTDIIAAPDDSSDNYGITFQKDDENSNSHILSGDWIVTNRGLFARDFSIEHDEHAPLSGKKGLWYTFARNTAVASFSQQNVD